MNTRIFAGLMLLCASTLVHAEVRIDDAWARASMPGQQVGGVFFVATSSDGAEIRGARCECAATVQLHQTQEQQGMARMVEQASVRLPAGQPVQFRPGGLHVMLFGLKTALREGQTFVLHLSVDEKGKLSEIPVKVTVRAAAAGMPHHHQGHQH